MRSENENIFRHIQNALIYSGAGLKAAWVNEMAFRTDAIVIALMMPIGIWIGETFNRIELGRMLSRLGLKPVHSILYFFRFFVGILAEKQ